ncbi:MAG: hypothetical protein ACRDVG_09000 [Jatrophihabitantaceae bacterium]
MTTDGAVTEVRGVRPLLNALLDALHPRDRLERACYTVGAVVLASGLVHIGVFLVRGGPWLGPVSLRKAVTFGLSFGLTVLSMTAVRRLLGESTRASARALAVFVAACVVEVVLVTMQAWRRVPSHFNRDTAFDSAVSTVLAAGGAAIVITSVVLTVVALRARGTASPIVALGVRAGLMIFLAALGVGAAMIARGVTLQREGNDFAADHHAGSLKPAHAAPMHAVLVLPLIAWLLGEGSWSERDRARLLWTAISGYVVTVLAVLVESIAGTDPLRPANPAALVSGLGLAVVLGVGLLALARAVRPRARDEVA